MLTAVAHGCACPSLCTYLLISLLESQNTMVGVFFLTGWFRARLRGEDIDLRQANSGLIDEGRLGGTLSGILLTSL